MEEDKPEGVVRTIVSRNEPIAESIGWVDRLKEDGTANLEPVPLLAQPFEARNGFLCGIEHD